MTINGSGASGNTGELGINGNNATVENVVFNGEGTGEEDDRKIAITVSTDKNNGGTTFKNVTVTNTFKGIQFWHLSGNSSIENCVLDVSGYTFNIDAVEANSTLTIKNSTLNGWTSYTSGNYEVSFTDCKLGLNTYEYLRPYAKTTLTNCEFTSKNYKLNASGTGTYTITLTNCTKNGTEITAENVQELLLDIGTTDKVTWNQHVTLIVNGTTVAIKY